MTAQNQNDSDDKLNGDQTHSEAPAGEIKSVPKDQDPLAEALQMAEKFKTDFLYLRAEFDNYKRNAIKERSDTIKYGSERLIVEILSAIDNFDRALETQVTAENFTQFVKGMELTQKEFKAALTKFGVTEVQTQGAAFDPATHEALGAEETKEIPSGHVFRVFKKAYKLHEKVIRPAQVIVAK